MQNKSTDKKEKNTAERTWFCVLNSPRTLFGNEMTEEEMVNAALDLWMKDKPDRSCAGNFEIGDTGNEHMHLVLCDPKKSRFAAIQKLYPGIHIEPLKGSKAQAQNYIEKKKPFQEKSHTLKVPPIYRGELIANPGKRRDLEEIEQMLADGYTPEQIMEKSLSYRRYESMIKSAYFNIQKKSIKPLRDVTVYWHVGDPGCGKTYTYVQLCEERGEDNIYIMSDYSTGGLDKYNSEPILFMDEFKGLLPFGTLLNFLEGYKKQIHCRYQNVYALWSEVHITSVFSPEDAYEEMVEFSRRKVDVYEQLRRRITYVIYHYKENGEYRQFELPIDEYTDCKDLERRAKGRLPPPQLPQSELFRQAKMNLIPDGFVPCDDQTVFPTDAAPEPATASITASESLTTSEPVTESPLAPKPATTPITASETMDTTEKAIPSPKSLDSAQGQKDSLDLYINLNQ